MADEDFKVGDIVIWTVGAKYEFHDEWGKITRITPAGTCFIQPLIKDAEEKSFRKGAWRFRKPTQYELDMRVWRKARPKTTAIACFKHMLARDQDKYNLEFQATTEDDDIVSKLEQVKTDAESMIEWMKAKPEH